MKFKKIMSKINSNSVRKTSGVKSDTAVKSGLKITDPAKSDAGVTKPDPEESGAAKPGLTEIVFILDRSGSMSGLESDTIGGFNSMIEKQKKEPGRALISTVLFDDRSEVLHDRLSLEKIPQMTDREYYVRGCTALLDAVGKSIRHVANIHKYADEDRRPERTLFVITTDGMENASREYDYQTVKKLVERQKEKYGWEFLFLGANIDAVETASRFGIDEDRAVNYHCDPRGTAVNYEAVGEAIRCARAGRALTAQWKAPIEADYRARKKN